MNEEYQKENKSKRNDNAIFDQFEICFSRDLRSHKSTFRLFIFKGKK